MSEKLKSLQVLGPKYLSDKDLKHILTSGMIHGYTPAFQRLLLEEARRRGMQVITPKGQK